MRSNTYRVEDDVHWSVWLGYACRIYCTEIWCRFLVKKRHEYVVPFVQWCAWQNHEMIDTLNASNHRLKMKSDAHTLHDHRHNNSKMHCTVNKILTHETPLTSSSTSFWQMFFFRSLVETKQNETKDMCHAQWATHWQNRLPSIFRRTKIKKFPPVLW